MMKAKLFGFLALAACTAAAASPTPRAAAPAESLSLDANSWGKPLSAWTVERSGAARYTFSRKVPGGHYRDYDLVTRSFRIRPADYSRVERLLRPARAYVGLGLPCRPTISDMVYGHVRWSKAEEISYDLGCTSDAVRPIYEKLEAAETLVKRLSEAGRIVATEQVRERRE
jgi:hypothetical protein